jgi:alpha-methylacyl-CoA racemase
VPDPATTGAADDTRGPLAEVRVLDLASVGPAARATSLLADYGADVVKVGPVPSASGVQIEPAFYAYGGHRGTRRFRCDLKSSHGREAFLSLADSADVVVESFRPGVADRLGIGYDALSARNPGLVYCSTSGYGQSGPRAGWAGHDLNYLAVGGFLATGETRADGGPPIPGATVADAAAGGMHAALAITAALAGRVRTGVGTRLDVSVAEGVLWLMSLFVDEYLATGAEPRPGHDILTGRYACYGTYRAADDRWLAVAAIEPKFFANLCDALGCPQWRERQLDDAVQGAIRADFAAAFAAKGRDEWVGQLGRADTCVAPVLTVADVADDEQFAARAVVVEAKSAGQGTFRQLRPLLAGMPAPAVPVELPDPAVTDTEALLREAGVDQAIVAAWLAEGVVA